MMARINLIPKKKRKIKKRRKKRNQIKTKLLNRVGKMILTIYGEI
jgi:hypothetical protein